jgi:hypothetical protein
MLQSRITQYFCSSRYSDETAFKIDTISKQFHTDIPVITNPKYGTVRFLRNGVKLVYLPRSDYYSVYTEKEITTGTIIAIEEATVGRKSDLVTFIEEHSDVGDDLYPRTFASTAEDKVNYNRWEWFDEETDNQNPEMKKCDALFFFMSKINHSCEPNVFVVRHDIVNIPDEDYIGVFVLVATKYIPAGKQLFISYGHNTGHENKFYMECSCWKDCKDRRRLFNQTVKLATRYWNHATSYYLHKLYPKLYSPETQEEF